MAQTNQCTLFDFMSQEIGIKVLHPGGYGATEELCSYCDIQPESHVLDLACGVGSTSFYLNDTFDCTVTGIDISEELIAKAKDAHKAKSAPEKVSFQVGDAFKLPFPDNHFDVLISQAFFVLVDDQEKALEEMQRVLKPGGSLGSIELSWHQQPNPELLEEIRTNTCNALIPRVRTFDGWETFFAEQMLQLNNSSQNIMESGMMKMIKSEGLLNFFKIMSKMMNSAKRKKMMAVQKSFKKYEEYLGYGIYHTVKEN